MPSLPDAARSPREFLPEVRRARRPVHELAAVSLFVLDWPCLPDWRGRRVPTFAADDHRIRTFRLCGIRRFRTALLVQVASGASAEAG